MEKVKRKISLKSIGLVVKAFSSKLLSFFKKGVFLLSAKYKLLYKVLTIMIFFAGLYLVIYPFVPRWLYYLFKDKYIFPYKTNIGEISGVNVDNNNTDIPTENRIVIPKINVDMTIVEGSDDNVLDLGIWHRPGSGTPGRGNMVLTGHRFGYEFLPEDIRNSTSFYNLDKLVVGDIVVIYWKGEEYDYIIEGSEVVDRFDISIEEQTQEEQLTLYTCHPIGRNDKRLVYYAKPY